MYISNSTDILHNTERWTIESGLITSKYFVTKLNQCDTFTEINKIYTINILCTFRRYNNI